MKVRNLVGTLSTFMKKNTYWFTLVELIVVITILVILSTIAFMQLWGFAGSARDSARVSDMNSIMQGLELAFVKSGSYPVPDASDKGVITITASGTIIGYQWYAGANILSSIKMSDAKDPLDKKYYTYVTNASYSKYQILELMEDGSTLGMSDAFGITHVYAGYETRTPATKGSSLGVLLGNTGSSLNVPVQELYVAGSFTGVDVFTTTGSYLMQFDKDTKISGTGIVLKSGIISPKGLIGYWDMETVSWGLLKDLSGNGNNAVCYSGTSSGSCGVVWPQIINGNGKTGKSMIFNGVNDWVSLWNQDWWNMDYYTILLKVSRSTPLSTTVLMNNYTSAENFALIRLWSFWTWQNWALNFYWWDGMPLLFGGKQLNVNAYYNLAITWDMSQTSFSSFTDGIRTGKQIIPLFNKFNSSAFSIGNNTNPFSGSLDEVRIYNRILSDSEILTLSNATK